MAASLLLDQFTDQPTYHATNCHSSMDIIVATTSAYWKPQAECIVQAMRQNGHQAHLATPQSIAQSNERSCELLFCIGSGESLTPFLGTITSACTILYLIESVPTLTESDNFTRGKLAVHAGYLDRFNLIFVHTRRSIPQLLALGISRVEELIWPHFPTIYHPVDQVEKDLDVLFIGNASEHRRQIVEVAAERFSVTAVSGAFFDKAANLYSRAKIALNIHFTALSNFECRVSEVLGCRTLLFTEALDPCDLLRDGEHLIVFQRDTLLELLDHYLSDPIARDRIALAGHRAIQAFAIEKQTIRILDVANGLGGLPARVSKASKSASGFISPPPHSNGPEMDPSSDPNSNRQSAVPTPTMAAKQLSVVINENTYTLQYPAAHSVDHMAQELYVKKVYPFLSFLPVGSGVIFDVGANIGCATILFRAFYPAAAIYAFEPDRETFNYLQLNTAQLSGIRIFNFGLFNRDACANLFQGTGTSTTNSICSSAHNTRQSQEITLRRASTVAAELGVDRISLLKIDTEGVEVPILEDFKPLLDRIGAIYLEYHSESDRLQIDGILSERFALCHASASLVHRGALAYVAKGIIADQTNMNRLEIIRPR